MQGDIVREGYLSFFEKRGHKIVESISLVPKDPTVLFTVAGMVPFKPYFLGKETPSFTRACSCQRCIRTIDIERIGKTDRHLTFFEMLGNFSFGDYWKEEAISWAWEFLTREMGLPPDRLYVSIFREDDEAETIWKKFLPSDRIIRLGEDSNFWKMAETGPCGPCSEILFDLGESLGCNLPSCAPGCDCDRYLELWNLVFTQYDRQADGRLLSLPKRNIDTGMGLERLCAVLQNKTSNFETDLMKPIIDQIEKNCELRIADRELRIAEKSDSRLTIRDSRFAIRVIADHIRAICHLIYDGVLPSNEERGYVLRRLIRRAVRCTRRLGILDNFLYHLVVDVANIFPYIKEKRDYIAHIISSEEDGFRKTIERGFSLLDERLSKGALSGACLFELYDTYGLPLEFAEEEAEERGIVIDKEMFIALREKARLRDRASAKITRGNGTIEEIELRDVSTTEFVGYRETEVEATVIKVVEDGVILDKTPFYPQSGGQIGDTGWLIMDNRKIQIEDTQKIGKVILHKTKDAELKEGDKVMAIIDTERRRQIARAHTATHLLHYALRQVLGEHIRQAGSLVSEDRLRFDFTCGKKLDEREIHRCEEIVVQKIMGNAVIEILEDIPQDVAKGMGAMALFEDEYGERVRVVKIGVSLELCGGTHLDKAGSVGYFKIMGETGVAAGIRRIEALTGLTAYAEVIKENDLLLEAERLLSTDRNRLVLRCLEVMKEKQEAEKEIERLKRGLLLARCDEIIGDACQIHGIKVVCQQMDGASKEDVASAVDLIASKIGTGCVVIAGTSDKNVFWAVRVTKDLIDRIDASVLIKEVTMITGGGGGGRPDFATGGGKMPEKILEAMEAVKRLIAGKTLANHKVKT
ncbi:alanine--tRNA ligase [bacterium]|nr:alanine--tRNA ligase [bacterium]